MIPRLLYRAEVKAAPQTAVQIGQNQERSNFMYVFRTRNGQIYSLPPLCAFFIQGGSFFLSRQLYCLESPHPLDHPMTAAVFIGKKKGQSVCELNNTDYVTCGGGQRQSRRLRGRWTQKYMIKNRVYLLIYLWPLSAANTTYSRNGRGSVVSTGGLILTGKRLEHLQKPSTCATFRPQVSEVLRCV